MGKLTKEDLEKKFRELREAWFDGKIRRYAQERVWEDLEQERMREKSNHQLKVEFDKHTEEILNGADISVTR